MAQGESQLQPDKGCLPPNTGHSGGLPGDWDTSPPPLWGDAILGTQETGTVVGPA